MLINFKSACRNARICEELRRVELVANRAVFINGEPIWLLPSPTPDRVDGMEFAELEVVREITEEHTEKLYRTLVAAQKDDSYFEVPSSLVQCPELDDLRVEFEEWHRRHQYWMKMLDTSSAIKKMNADEKARYYRDNLVTCYLFNTRLAEYDEVLFEVNVTFSSQSSATKARFVSRDYTIGFITKSAIATAGLTIEQVTQCIEIPQSVYDLCANLHSCSIRHYDATPTDRLPIGVENYEVAVEILYPGYEFKEMHPEEMYQAFGKFKAIVDMINRHISLRLVK